VIILGILATKMSYITAVKRIIAKNMGRQTSLVTQPAFLIFFPLLRTERNKEPSAPRQ
jgi:hypothetical protein